MKISCVLNNNYHNSFKGANISINAFSDTHGELFAANSALEEIRLRQQDLFYKDEKGNSNILALCGDWFIDGGRKGYKNDKNKSLAFFQLDMLNEFINQIKGIAQNTLALFTPGNHEFDGGIPLLDDVLSELSADIIATNIDLNNSDALSKSKDKIVNEKILEVSDDKNTDLTHKILVLGILPVNLNAYQKNTEGLILTDNSSIIQKDVKKEDYISTFELCKSKIKSFKENNPDGIVVIMNHTGVGFADNLVKESPVNLVFDGHEHKENIRFVNNTPIVPLSMNFKKIVNAKIRIDDEGKLDTIQIKDFNPLVNKRKGPLLKLYQELFREDIKPQYSIIFNSPDIKELDIKGIREGNNNLANFVTDAILEQIHKIDSGVDFFALNSSSIRHSLAISDKPSVSSFDVMNVLAGIREADGEIYTTKLKGIDIIKLIVDNFLFNKDMPQKNTLIHYSGLSIDRTSMMKDLENGEEIKNLAKYVYNKNTGKIIDADEEYTIANAVKYFDKNQNPEIRDLKSKSDDFGFNVQELFKRYFEDSNGIIRIDCEDRIK